MKKNMADILAPLAKEAFPEPPLRRTRVRLEFTVAPRGSGLSYRTSPKLSFLCKLLEEKFGPEAKVAFRDWMRWTAMEQYMRGAVLGEEEGSDGKKEEE